MSFYIFVTYSAKTGRFHPTIFRSTPLPGGFDSPDGELLLFNKVHKSGFATEKAANEHIIGDFLLENLDVTFPWKVLDLEGDIYAPRSLFLEKRELRSRELPWMPELLLSRRPTG